MKFDFYSRYKNLSDTELLHIVHNRGQYQETAWEAAYKLLEERNVDMTPAALPASNDTATTAPEEDLETLLAADPTQPATRYKTLIEAIYKEKNNKQFLLFKIVIFIYTVSAIYSTYSGILILKDGFLSYTLYLPVKVITMASIFLPWAILLLLYRLNRWGWILYVAVSCSTTLGLFISCIITGLNGYHPDQSGDILTGLFVSALNVGSMLIFCRSYNKTLLGISPNTQNITIIIGLVIGLLNVAMMYFSPFSLWGMYLFD